MQGWHRLILLTLVLLAFIPAIDATYMLGKAKLAQLLIANTWQSGDDGAKPWPWADTSVAVGEPGVVMIAGHRDTSFKPLQHVAIGHSIYLEDHAGQIFTYRVTDISIADARNTSVSAETKEPTLVLVTCYPFNALTAGGPMRYVVQATLVQHTTMAQEDSALPEITIAQPGLQSIPLSRS